MPAAHKFNILILQDSFPMTDIDIENIKIKKNI